eukprot:TRINITY_DN12701_c0_g1_i2.p1 TRINITY_DN12701_c0_g1~~TRINITY_DN12701_c0_g1_i2.p1  ORF type:complete len:205 (-),score=31.21 TRINITY_DN12701_c0_g1_i2:60-674(-)
MYHKVQCGKHLLDFHGNQLFDPYFQELKNGSVAACNGWIMNADPCENFAESDQFRYLRRHIVIWGDLLKFRYGKSPEDSPLLWSHMTKYVQEMAGIFHGFRIDNAHSTPLHVGDYLLQKAREVNPNLLVFSELFSGSQEADATFVKRLGLNALVREAINPGSPKDLSGYLHYYSSGLEVPVGSIKPFYNIGPKNVKQYLSLIHI